QVDRAETFIRRLGIQQVRVRHHGDFARIEVEPRDFGLLDKHEREIADHLSSLGFTKVEIDPDGYGNTQSEARTAVSGLINVNISLDPLAVARGTDTNGRPEHASCITSRVAKRSSRGHSLSRERRHSPAG